MARVAVPLAGPAVAALAAAMALPLRLAAAPLRGTPRRRLDVDRETAVAAAILGRNALARKALDGPQQLDLRSVAERDGDA